MAKYKTSLKRTNAFHLDSGAQKLLKQLDDAGKNCKPALEAAARKSLPLVQKSFKEFMSEHRVSGQTEASLIEPSQTEFMWGKQAKKRFVGETKSGVKGFSGGHVEVVSEEDVLFFEYGFDAKKGGVVALFLDVGTPKRAGTGKVEASYFIFYAVEDNLAQIHKIQNEELTRVLKGLI